MRALRPSLLILLAALLAAGPALAGGEEGAKPRKRRIVASQSLPPPPARRTPTPVPAAASLPPALQAGAAFAEQGLALTSLASGGLRSGWAPANDPAGQCRAACAQVRLRCDAEEAAPECAPRWSQCVAGCRR